MPAGSLRPIGNRLQEKKANSESLASLSNVEQHLETVIHVELLMAVKQRQPVHLRCEVGFDFLEAFHQDYILQNSRRRLAVDVGQFEAVPMQMDRVRIIRLVVEHKPVAFSLL